MQIIPIAGLASLWVKQIQRAGGDSTWPLQVWGQTKQGCGLCQLSALKGKCSPLGNWAQLAQISQISSSGRDYRQSMLFRSAGQHKERDSDKGCMHLLGSPRIHLSLQRPLLHTSCWELHAFRINSAADRAAQGFETFPFSFRALGNSDGQLATSSADAEHLDEDAPNPVSTPSSLHCLEGPRLPQPNSIQLCSCCGTVPLPHTQTPTAQMAPSSMPPAPSLPVCLGTA